jgi:predicted nuclease with RNAse H fold
MIVGVDYGSKMAGTTVISFLKEDEVILSQSEKKKDADAFLLSLLSKIEEPTVIGFDAPLSLPGIYTNIPKCNDFHYRQCDREVRAMSPMFLGGLTARAMKLKHQLSSDQIQFYETYPALQAKRLELEQLDYKKTSAQYTKIQKRLQQELGVIKLPELVNAHQVDAILALIGAHRIKQRIAKSIGNPKEGLIHV